ncbi:glycosyltransferase [Lactiplantibacillus plantarum]|uniref:glycosyltransferase n=1 Tax=Lactiplantibacillus plantarum TaxID=1590 RepID=UPI0030AEE1C7
MKVMIVVENTLMDGTKRASIVLGNCLNKYYQVNFYTLSDTPTYFKLSAPLIVAPRPFDSTVLNFRGSNPYLRYHNQIIDLINCIKTQHFQVVILTGGLLTSFSPLIKKKLPKINLIGWMHNNYITYMNNYYVQMQEELKEGLRTVETLVTLTQEDQVSYSYFNSRTVKIYNPLTLVPSGKADLDSHRVAFTGRISIFQKGIDYLLEAATFLTGNWKIVIAGSGTDEEMNKFYELIDRYGVAHKIIYEGALKDQALREHYESASIFVSTSRWEGMPLVIGEAMATGLPIVAMENSGSKEFIGKNKYGFLTKPRDVPDLVSHLNQLIVNKELRCYYAHQSLRRTKDFSPDVVLKKWIPIIEYQLF